MRGKWRAQRADRGAHAARGFVGGATTTPKSHVSTSLSFNAARGFLGGAAATSGDDQRRQCCFNAARGFVGGAAR